MDEIFRISRRQPTCVGEVFLYVGEVFLYMRESARLVTGFFEVNLLSLLMYPGNKHRFGYRAFSRREAVFDLINSSAAVEEIFSFPQPIEAS